MGLVRVIKDIEGSRDLLTAVELGRRAGLPGKWGNKGANANIIAQSLGLIRRHNGRWVPVDDEAKSYMKNVDGRWRWYKSAVPLIRDAGKTFDWSQSNGPKSGAEVQTPHPVAAMFPPMTDKEYADLKEDIGAHGLLTPIIMYQGQILDSLDRLRVCEELGIAPVFHEYKGHDPVGYAVKLNLNNRHLSKSQRAALAANLTNIPHGGDRRSKAP